MGRNPTPPVDAATSTMGYLEFAVLPPATDLMPPEMAAVFAYWQGLRGDRFAPSWPEFKLYQLPPAVLPLVIVVDISDDQDRITYRFWGSGRTSLYGTDGTGRDVRETLPDQAGNQVVEQYRLMIAARAPVLFRNTYPLKPKQRSVCMTLRLPLSSDGVRVDGACSLAIFTENEAQLAELFNTLGSS